MLLDFQTERLSAERLRGLHCQGAAVLNRLALDIIANARELTEGKDVGWDFVLQNIEGRNSPFSKSKAIKWTGPEGVAFALAAPVGSVIREFGKGMDSPEAKYLSASSFARYLRKRALKFGRDWRGVELSGDNRIEKQIEVLKQNSFLISSSATEFANSHFPDPGLYSQILMELLNVRGTDRLSYRTNVIRQLSYGRIEHAYLRAFSVTGWEIDNGR